MGAFIEQADDVSAPKIFTNQFITDVVKKSIANGDIPDDHKLAFIGVVDEKGVRAIVSAQIAQHKIGETSNLNVRVQGIFEHEWTGENKAGAQLLFSIK